ncbi:MAG: PRC-barrel domain-containing protein [Bacillota bacterium]|nr:PRC-barrel domain-containing protein [Bacillota bacterium]
MSEIVGMKVLDSKGGFAGEVETVVYSRNRRRIVGLLLKRGKLARSMGAVLYRDIVSIGDSVIIVAQNAVMNPGSSAEIERTMQEDSDIIGHRVFTSEGKEIGMVKDVVFNENGGSVEGYILAGDFIDDLLNGRKMFKLTDNAVIGEGSIILNGERSDFSTLSNSGLKSIFGLKD